MNADHEAIGRDTCARIARVADEFFRDKANRPYEVSLESYLLQLPQDDAELARPVLETAELLFDLTRDYSALGSDEIEANYRHVATDGSGNR
jgi:hypothetical protein